MMFTSKQMMIALGIALVATFGLRGVLRGLAGIGGIVVVFILIAVGLLFLSRYFFAFT